MTKTTLYLAATVAIIYSSESWAESLSLEYAFKNSQSATLQISDTAFTVNEVQNEKYGLFTKRMITIPSIESEAEYFKLQGAVDAGIMDWLLNPGGASSDLAMGNKSRAQKNLEKFITTQPKCEFQLAANTNDWSAAAPESSLAYSISVRKTNDKNLIVLQPDLPRTSYGRMRAATLVCSKNADLNQAIKFLKKSGLTLALTPKPPIPTIVNDAEFKQASR